MQFAIIIKTDMLCKSFITDGEINHVIKNMNLEIYEGDFTVIMGSSGSGKSTLLYSLSGMDDVSGGKVYLGDREITALSENELSMIRKREIGFVFQGINLVENLSIYENIISPTYKTAARKKDVAEYAEALIEKFGLKGHENKFPTQMSGGQRQRAAICRALINKPGLLFADEPTGALNSSQGQDVLDVFTRVNKEGQSVVMVTHDLKAALRGNRIIYLKDGRIDGDLSLPPYNPQTVAEREEEVYQFLKARKW